jgi:peptidoglycan/xylan/chitin deacetylase (PgdA/CDA1 family)
MCCELRSTAGWTTLALLLGALAASRSLAAEPGVTHVAPWKDDKRAPFVLMFDDSMTSHVSTVLPELKRRKLTGVFYVNPGSGHYAKHKAVWEEEMPAAGMVLANHTFTHKGAADVANCEEEITKCNDVLYAIAAAKEPAGKEPKPTLLSFGRPGVPQGKWNVTDEELAGLLKKHHLVLRPNIQFAQIHLKDAPAMIARVEKALASGKPDAVAFHGVGGEWLSIDVPAFLALLDAIDAKRDQLWVTDPISIHKYETQRDAAKVEVASAKPQQIRLKLTTSGVDPQTYDTPLTLVTQVPPAWKGVKVTQGAKSTTVAASGGTVKVDPRASPPLATVKYDARPGGDPIVLEPTP